MRGKVSQWNDDKGFGFIHPENNAERLFFHISSVKTQARRPLVGDTVLYDSKRDSQNRLRAEGVVIEGIVAKSHSRKKSTVPQNKPPKKTVLDYGLIFFLLGSLFAVAYVYFKTGSIESALPYGIPAVVSFLLVHRQKKPKEKKFSCARCKKIAEHDKRTIKAWNSGFLKLYCSSCHKKWLSENPARTLRAQPSNRAGGCLGILVILAVAPIIAVAGIYRWLA